jgi:hypothetical protein
MPDSKATIAYVAFRPIITSDDDDHGEISQSQTS